VTLLNLDIVELELAQEAQSSLREITERLGLGDDFGEAIGRALGMEVFLLREASLGNKVIIVGKNGRQRELLVGGAIK